jgi:holo-[acyl-carrier protein] synthase
MILGIGTDLANIERIEATLARFGPRFTARVFTDEERRKAERRHQTAATYAKRWAAKEACSKALGTGLPWGSPGATWRCATSAPASPRWHSPAGPRTGCAR